MIGSSNFTLQEENPFFMSLNLLNYQLDSLWIPIDWSGNRRLQREQRELKAPQERSDEEIEVVPAESVRLERKSMVL